ncbi:MAG: methylmalonyl Co-A mutase-associated GTPase MeaB [Bacteroidetes bacterium]|nr:methylmalonyl Co-A mutase-associated GTPase MeaB [Bacteroidota bacterium]
MPDANKKDKKSALHVNKGIEQPSQINPLAAGKLKGLKKPDLNASDFLRGILSGDRAIFSKAITLIESTLPKHQDIAQEIISLCLPHSGKSIRVGITGVPGVGKSTFIEALGLHLTGSGHRIAVLAIDPSSQRSKGSILGDKTRMEDLANHPNAYIRPSSSGGSLGGVSRKTREAIIICEAAGFDVIFVETVGVGQSETAVHSMVDFFLLLMLSGAGDELQGIKRGIMEMADALVINKADGDNIQRAKLAKAEYENALHMFPPPASGWLPPVKTCSAQTKQGISEVWNNILDYMKLTKGNGYFLEKRQRQNIGIMYEALEAELRELFYRNPEIKTLQKKLETDILANKTSPYLAASLLINAFKKPSSF